MTYRLATLLVTVTATCVVLGLLTHGIAISIVIGLPLGLLVWELVQFRRELDGYVASPSIPPSETSTAPTEGWAFLPRLAAIKHICKWALFACLAGTVGGVGLIIVLLSLSQHLPSAWLAVLPELFDGLLKFAGLSCLGVYIAAIGWIISTLFARRRE